MRIGVAGTGRMGTEIVRRLIATGHDVGVWNRTVENARDAREAGARWIATLGELVDDSEVVISFLLDNAAVERVYPGPNGLLPPPLAKPVFLNISTLNPPPPPRTPP